MSCMGKTGGEAFMGRLDAFRTSLLLRGMDLLECCKLQVIMVFVISVNLSIKMLLLTASSHVLPGLLIQVPA